MEAEVGSGVVVVVMMSRKTDAFQSLVVLAILTSFPKHNLVVALTPRLLLLSKYHASYRPNHLQWYIVDSILKH